MDWQTRIGAHIDGELPPDEAAQFEAAMAADPALAASVQRQLRLKDGLRRAYEPDAEEPMPAAVMALLSAANDRPPARRGAGALRPAAWAAMAACLVGGVLAGRLAPSDTGPVRLAAGRLEARAGLARALDTALAAQAGPVRVGLSFRTQAGDYCRSFTSEQDRLAGLACKQHGRWIAQTLTAWAPQADPAYRTAGSETPAPILAAIDALAAAPPLDASGERAARDRGWRD